MAILQARNRDVKGICCEKNSVNGNAYFVMQNTSYTNTCAVTSSHKSAKNMHRKGKGGQTFKN